MKRLVLWMGVTLMMWGATGCIVRETRVPACRGGFWVEGHYGPRGRWHPGHWRCPGGVEVIKIE